MRRFGTDDDEPSLWLRDHVGSKRQGRGVRRLLPASIVLVLLATACGGSPLESVGQRSSEWINEPTVPTTIPVQTTIPKVVDASTLLWSNDEIETENLDDVPALLDEVFRRREGDRFIQASRFEIAAVIPDLVFPSIAPSGAKWVSSQLVFSNDGTLAADPSAAFGIWSAEPYTRSRSVAQMAVLRVSYDLENATEIATSVDRPSCARFADRSANSCEVVPVGNGYVWVLEASAGTTAIWFEGAYRYELFGRAFVPTSVLIEMSGDTVLLSSIVETSS